MTTYKEAGVDVEGKNFLLDKLKAHVKETFDGRVMSSDTLFKGLLFNASELKNFDEPMLAFNCDGAGTKTVIAGMMGKWEGIGKDIVNHCINDVLTMGAKPLCFSDYVASDKLKPEVVEAIVRGVTGSCKDNGIVFVGGETAEMPSVYTEGETDVAGFILGAAEKKNAIDGKDVSEGDVLIGISSVGLHTNGFSLARKVLFEDSGMDVNSDIPELGMKLGDALLVPHRNYLKTTLAVMEKFKINAIAHITGGSFKKNMPRILPAGLGAEIKRSSWDPLPIFKLIQEKGNVEINEMYDTFNMGIGFVYVISSNDGESVLNFLKELGEEAFIIGKVVSGEGVQYVG
jgi:phosphoribosylformylglycinamidine cyclo-ligase